MKTLMEKCIAGPRGDDDTRPGLGEKVLVLTTCGDWFGDSPSLYISRLYDNFFVVGMWYNYGNRDMDKEGRQTLAITRDRADAQAVFDRHRWRALKAELTTDHDT